MPFRSPQLLSFKEILILVLILTALTAILFYAFGPNLGRNLSYAAIIIATISALIIKNTPLKQKLQSRFQPSKPAN